MHPRELTVGGRIKLFRENCHLTQEELAKQIGTTPQNIYKYEHDIITNIPITRIAQIASVVGIPPARIAGWDMEVEVNYTSLPDSVGSKYSRLDREDKIQAEKFIDYLLSEDKYKKQSSAG